MSKFLKFLSIITALTLFLVGCSSKTNSNPTSTEKIKIVTSVNFYAEVAKAVAGDKAEVSSIISSSSIDPHDFEPTAQDAKTVADSKIAILNGGGYDSWFEKLTNNSKNITKIDGAKLLDLKEGENEHIWYNPEVMSNGKSVLTTEPVFEYAVKSLGLKVSDEVNKLAQATEEGNDPAPQDLKNIQQQIKNKQISLIINNVQTTNKTVEGLINLAEQNNIPILNVTETQPDGKTYIEWMLDQYNKLEEILNGGKGEKAYHTENAKESHSHNHDHEGHDHNHEGHNHNH